MSTYSSSGGLTFLDGSNVALAEEISRVVFATNLDGHDLTTATMLVNTRQLSFVLFNLRATIDRHAWRVTRPRSSRERSVRAAFDSLHIQVRVKNDCRRESQSRLTTWRGIPPLPWTSLLRVVT